MAFGGAKTKPNLFLTLSRSLISYLMNEHLKEKQSSAVQIWPTATMPWVMWPIHKVSGGKKECSWKSERRFCLTKDHPLGIFLAGSLGSRHWVGHRGKNNHFPPGLHHPEEEEDSPETLTPCAKKGQARRTPGTLTKLGKNTAACLLLEKQNSHPQDNTHCYI